MTDQPPFYVSRATLARRLEIGESTVDEMVRRGVLPKPIRLSNGCVRWQWAAVERALASLGGQPEIANVDPYLAGVLNVTEGPRSGTD